MNQVTLIGRFVADPTISATNSGKQLCKFTLAIKRPHDTTQSDFFDLIAWENTGSFISKHFSKGQRVAITGYLVTHKWEDKKGVKQKKTEIVVEKAFFADGSPSPEVKTQVEDDPYSYVDEDKPGEDDFF